MTRTATATLRNEHETILRILDVCEHVAGRLRNSVPVAPATLNALLEFFQLFADRCHHGKEEDLLFPLLETKGLPKDGGPIGVMLHEHTVGRSLVREMAGASLGYASGREGAGRQWAEAANGYSSLLRAHIQKENNILFVMAERLLSDGEQADLAAAFERNETEKMGPGTMERLRAMTDRLSEEVFDNHA
jgi:hemerythrin-like domain-containing protein